MDIEKNDIEAIICSECTEIIEQFRYHFNYEMNNFVETFCSAFNQFQNMSGDRHQMVMVEGQIWSLMV